MSETNTYQYEGYSISISCRPQRDSFEVSVWIERNPRAGVAHSGAVHSWTLLDSGPWHQVLDSTLLRAMRMVDCLKNTG